MYAIVDIAGQQLKVEKDQQVYVNRLNSKEGEKVEFSNVLLIENDGDVTVGAPAVKDALVTATVIGHLKGDKVIIFKKKRRKGYQKRTGHRQYLTQIKIEGISTGAVAKSNKKEEPAKKAAPKATEDSAKPAKSASAATDDLTRIKGIGPAAAEKLYSIGINSFKQLSNLSDADIEKIAGLEGFTADTPVSQEWSRQANELLKK